MPGFVLSRPSYVDETLFGNDHAVAKSRLAAKSRDTTRLTAGIVAASDVERMRMSATFAGQVTDPQALREASLRAMSQARTAKWPNTLEAQRKKKEAARQERLQAEEALRCAIDKEEEALKAEQRRLAIERANKMLYDQTDRVKALHTRMHMADIEGVRAEQIAFKERAKERDRRREAMWVEQQKDMLRKMDAEEDARDAEDYARRMEERRLREVQVALKHAEYADKLETIKREGELMRAKAAEDLHAEREMEKARMETEKAAREESMRLNDYLKELKKQQALDEAAEDEKMRKCVARRTAGARPLPSTTLAGLALRHRAFFSRAVFRPTCFFAASRARYAVAKEKSLLARRAREEERFAARQAVRQRMIDAQVERLARMQQTTDARVQRQVDELNAQTRAAEKARQAKARDDLIATHVSRQQQLKWKADALKQEKLERDHFASQLGELNERLRGEELAKSLHDRKERERLDDFLFDQMAQKQAQELAERQAEVQEADHIRQFLDVSRASRRARPPWGAAGRCAAIPDSILTCTFVAVPHLAPLLARRRTRMRSSSSTPRCASQSCRRRARAQNRSSCCSPKRRSSSTEQLIQRQQACQSLRSRAVYFKSNINLGRVLLQQAKAARDRVDLVVVARPNRNHSGTAGRHLRPPGVGHNVVGQASRLGSLGETLELGQVLRPHNNLFLATSLPRG